MTSARGARYLVRTAKAVKRTQWNGDDRERMLSEAGRAQARGLSERLRGTPLGRLLAGPERRSRETLEPIAAERGLPLELDPRLGERAGPAELLDLLGSLEPWPAVICAHGAAIEGALALWRADRVALERTDAPKASLWALHSGPVPERVRYFEPLELERGERLAPRKRVSARERARVAVLDLGSTSFHLLVSDIDASGEIERVTRERVMLRLGASLARGGRIPDEVVARALTTARELCSAAERAGAGCLLPVATAALREATNGAEVALRIGTELGVPVRVLSGEREARVIFAAMRRRLRSEDETVLGVDLGGGSLELIAGDDDGVHWEATLPLGVARLHSEFVAHDPMRSDEADRIRARVRELVAPFRAKIEQIEPVRAIASGGTIGALVRRLQARRDEAARRSLRGSRVGPADLEALVEELVPSSHAERLALRGIEEARADLLPSGALVLRALADTLALPGYTYSDWGLREGILLETVGLESPAPGPEELL